MKNHNLESSWIIYIFFSTMLFFSCQEELTDEVSFSRILDDQSFASAYEPIAVRPTQDGGAIIIAANNSDPEAYPAAVVIKVDEMGLWVSEESLGEPYVSPSGELMELDGQFYFFVMDENNYRSYLVSADQEGAITEPILVSNGITFPLASALIDNNIYLLGYDAVDKQSVLAQVTVDGSVSRLSTYTIGEGSDADPVILNHFAQRKSRLPFSIGLSAGNVIYFNGLFNYSFSLVFSGFADDPQGVIQGQGEFGGISSLMPVAGGGYALTGFQFEQNFVRSNVQVNETGLSSSIDYLDRDQVEMKANSKTKIISYQLDEEIYTIVAAETESRQIVFYIYDAQGDLTATHYIGNINSFNLGDLAVSDVDNSLLALGSTFTAGRFERLFIQKFSAERMKEIIMENQE